MPAPGLFRQRALERFGSPDEFDRLVRVTSPRHWIGLTGLLTVVVAAVLWAFFTTIPTTETGVGFYLPEGGLRPIESPAAGELDTLPIVENDHVIAGEKVGEVRVGGGRFAPIRATGTGVVTETNAQLGTHVNPGDQMAL